MKRITMTALAVAGLCVAAKPAMAQSGTQLRIGAGLVLPMSDWGSTSGLNDKMGFSGGAGVSFGFGTAPVRLRVEGSWTQTSHQTGIDGNTRVLGGMASLVYPIAMAGSLKPYVLAGVGFNNTKLTLGGSDTSKSSVGFGGGGGLSFAMSSASLYVEARYLTHKAFDMTFAQVPITVGISFPLGAKR